MWQRFDDWERTKPRAVKDGIRAQSRGGKFASSWWGRRWLEVLEGFGWDSRLQRGRTYARKGQVTELTIGEGGVAAKVQGSRPRPYGVQIRLQPLTDSQWEQAVASLEAQPLLLGLLLSGEMPEEIEPVFSGAQAHLFPQRRNDLEMNCSCPDSAVPCKHLAAVYYLLAEWLDRDPFVLFELRGRDRETLLAALRERQGQPAPAPEPEEPLTVEGFWAVDGLPARLTDTPPPAVAQALLRALGDPPAWTGPPLATALRPVYEAVAAEAARLLEGEE